VFSVRCALFSKSAEGIDNTGLGGAVLAGKALIVAQWCLRGVTGEIGSSRSLRSLRRARGMDRESWRDSAAVCVLIPPYIINCNTFQGYSVSILFEWDCWRRRVRAIPKHCVDPPGLRWIFRAYPGLPPWARLCRPSGAGMGVL
jgi:hypothetical protein